MRFRLVALVNSLLPGLPSPAGRSVATMLRDGVPAADALVYEVLNDGDHATHVCWEAQLDGLLAQRS